MLWQTFITITVTFYAGIQALSIDNDKVDVTENNKPGVIVCNIPNNDAHDRSERVNIIEHNKELDMPGQNDEGSSSTIPNSTELTTPESVKIVQTDSSQEIYLDPGLISVEVATGDDVVKTEYGEVQGFYKHGNNDILSFFDIPYGNFTRFFEPPRYPLKWEAVHAVNEHVKRCPQYDGNQVTGDLDCLTLSVFIPPNVTNAKVLFHIHDSGNFESGSGDDLIYGPKHLVAKGIILVLPNYRLGPLGFLCLRNETAPGNAALKDLTIALDWTRRNIKAFGGDPFDITVSGEGSGGALAMYLALSPISKVYISKVITDSGSALSHWALDRRPIVTAIMLAATIQVEIKRLHEVFESVDLETLIKASRGLVFKPCIENRASGFITESPWILYRYQSNITFMIGTANHAGMREALAQTNDSLQSINNDLSFLLPSDLAFENSEERQQISQRIKEQYFGENITIELLTNLSLCYTDMSYTTPVIRSVRALVESGASVYLYEFSYVGDLNREETGLTSLVNGAAKGDIIGYTFSQEAIPQAESDEEYMLDLVTDLWVSFMETGIPSGDNIVWNKVNKTDNHSEEWLSIGPVVTSEIGLHVERMKLWTEIYDSYYIERNRSFNLKTDGLYLFIVSLALLDVYLKN